MSTFGSAQSQYLFKVRNPKVKRREVNARESELLGRVNPTSGFSWIRILDLLGNVFRVFSNRLLLKWN